MTQEKENINQQLLDHLESGTWDPHRQQQTSASDKARLVFDLQQRASARRKNMQPFTSRPFRAMVWVLVLFMFAAATWAFINQGKLETVDNLANPNLPSEENTYTSELVGAEPVPIALKALRFGDDIYLNDYRIRIHRSDRETFFHFRLYWSSVTDPTGRINIFVHLLSQDSSLVAQYDRSIFDSDISLCCGWRNNGPALQDFAFTIEDDLAAAGPYQVFFGLYDKTTGNRLPISYLDQPQADDQLLLTEVNTDEEQELIITRADNGTMVVTKDLSETILTVGETQSLLLINDEGVAIVAFQFEEWEENISYRWRHLSFGEGIVTSDEGILQNSVGDGLHLVPAKRELPIGNDMNIKWSFAGNNHGWIYYDPHLIDAKVIDDDFNSFDLSTVMP